MWVFNSRIQSWLLLTQTLLRCDTKRTIITVFVFFKKTPKHILKIGATCNTILCFLPSCALYFFLMYSILNAAPKTFPPFYFLCRPSIVQTYRLCVPLCRIHEVTDRRDDEQILTYSHRWECAWFCRTSNMDCDSQVRVRLIINSWITRKTDLDHRVRSKFMIQLSLAVWSNFTCSV